MTNQPSQSKYALKRARRRLEARKRGLDRDATWPQIWAYDRARVAEVLDMSDEEIEEEVSNATPR